jgi:arsenite methyltransferase
MSEIDERNVKQCCASFYGSDLARLLLGDSFHPGGVRLTDRLGELTEISADSRVLDVAAGRGTSAFRLVESFGCEVTGVDLHAENVKLANDGARDRGVAERVSFRVADADQLPFDADSFDTILCECAFCTFPNKRTAAAEFSRVLRAGGRVGLSDLTKVTGPLAELDGLLSWIACIGDAKPVELYVEILQQAGLTVENIEDHSDALTELVHQIQGKLFGVEIAVRLKKLPLADVNFRDANRFAQAALSAVNARRLGYTIITCVK